MGFKFQLPLKSILKIRENFDFKKLHLSLTVLSKWKRQACKNKHVSKNNEIGHSSCARKGSDRLNVPKNIACLSDWSSEMPFFFVAWRVFVFSWVDYELPVIENVSF